MAGLTINNPVTLKKAIVSKNVLPGDTLAIRGGTYTASEGGVSGSYSPGKGVFKIKLHGTAAAPITIMPYNNEPVRINGGLELVTGLASYIIVKDLEIAPTPTDRNVEDFPDCIYCSAPSCQFIGNVLHDGHEGISLFGAGGSTVKDNVIYNIGWHDGVKLRGTGIYTHNHPGGAVIIRNNTFNALGEQSAALWSASINNVQDYTFEENVVLDASFICSSQNGLCEDNLIQNNHLYRATLRVGASNSQNGTITVNANRTYQDFVTFQPWYQNSLNAQNNIFYNDAQTLVTFYDGLGTVNNTINNNTYRGVDVNDGVYDNDLAQLITWATWQSRGYDTTSAFDITLPSTNETFLYTLTNGSALLVIWNWELLNNVDVDVSAVFGASGTVQAHNIQDYFNDIQTLPITGGVISVNMEAINRTVIAPVGWTAPATTFPNFGAFRLEL